MSDLEKKAQEVKARGLKEDGQASGCEGEAIAERHGGEGAGVDGGRADGVGCWYCLGCLRGTRLRRTSSGEWAMRS